MADRGRPTIYKPEIADYILGQMELGRTLRSICEEEGMPSHPTVRLWADINRDGFTEKFNASRLKMADAIHDEIIDIADDTSNDVLERRVVDGKKTRVEFVTNHAAVARAKLRCDVRARWAAKANPVKYGERKAVDVGVQADSPLLGMLAKVAGAALPIAATVSSNEE